MQRIDAMSAKKGLVWVEQKLQRRFLGCLVYDADKAGDDETCSRWIMGLLS